jgi:hypothetical protein
MSEKSAKPNAASGGSFQVNPMDTAGPLQKSPYASSIEEAQFLVRRCAEPRRAGDGVKAAMRRASQLLNMPFARTRDIWYGDAKRIAADEMDRLRRTAEDAELTLAVAGIEFLRSRLLASCSPAADELIAGLTAALLAIGRDAGESRLRQEPDQSCFPPLCDSLRNCRVSS